MRRAIESAATIIGVAALLSSGGSAQTGTPGVVAMTPEEIEWSDTGGLAWPGMAQANLVGDPAKPGPYTLRLKFPAGSKLAPHTHPDSREVTILAGTWYTGYGEKFDLRTFPTLWKPGEKFSSR